MRLYGGLLVEWLVWVNAGVDGMARDCECEYGSVDYGF